MSISYLSKCDFSTDYNGNNTNIKIQSHSGVILLLH